MIAEEAETVLALQQLRQTAAAEEAASVVAVESARPLLAWLSSRRSQSSLASQPPSLGISWLPLRLIHLQSLRLSPHCLASG